MNTSTKIITSVFKKVLYRSSPTILTVVASVGVIVTTITAVRATPKAIKLLKEAEAEKGENLTKVEIIRVAGPSYIPSTLLGISTIVCIFGANDFRVQRLYCLERLPEELIPKQSGAKVVLKLDSAEKFFGIHFKNRLF